MARESRPLERTKEPGIYKRGSRYVVVYRDPDGRQRKRAAATLAEARTIKSGVRTDISRGEYQPQTKLTVQQFYDEWIDRYQGRTRKGIRANTVEGYRQQMEGHVLPTLGRRRLAEIGPRDIKSLAADLGKALSANSVRLAIAPLKAMLAEAFEEELIRRNPAANVRIARPANADAPQAEKVKALTPKQLGLLLAKIPERHRLPVEVLAQTGLRIGELAALTWADVDVGRQRIHVRRRWYRGGFDTPKSKFGVRQVPITKALAQRLWKTRGTAPDDALVFGTRNGTPMAVTNYYNRVYKPAAKAAGVEWATLHTLRHTCASILFNQGGKNPKQVQAWLGHHSASFTLDTYIHLLGDDIGEAPAELDSLTVGATEGQHDVQNEAETQEAETA